ncbi:MAG: hypothetical protein J2P20_11170 [Pseudonocardia sp.]|nr:hypothetical protein [Pseudonocardia sp.]
MTTMLEPIPAALREGVKPLVLAVAAHDRNVAGFLIGCAAGAAAQQRCAALYLGGRHRFGGESADRKEFDWVQRRMGRRDRMSWRDATRWAERLLAAHTTGSTRSPRTSPAPVGCPTYDATSNRAAVPAEPDIEPLGEPMTVTTTEIPRFATVGEALDHLTSQGDATAQAAYLERLAITGRRGECEACAVASYVYATTGIRVSVDPAPPGNIVIEGWGADGGQELSLSSSTRTLAVRFDGHAYPNLTDPCSCGAPHEHPVHQCCDENTCVGHLPDCPDRPDGEGDKDDDWDM